MSLLLDTQLAIWWQIAPARLPESCVNAVLGDEGDVFVSRASLWEMAIKHGLGKLHLDLPRFAARIEADGFRWLAIENRHILELSALPQADDHKDPFDRLLAAQSRCEPLILLTTDAKLARYGSTVRVV
ncbi:MAG: type II toxin-antitoxin system VapC family toxin [Burkholderiales bacterium]|nr:type II toxin-antitoxin system VapC family toxin [Burkholderiales bacterium]